MVAGSGRGCNFAAPKTTPLDGPQTTAGADEEAGTTAPLPTEARLPARRLREKTRSQGTRYAAGSRRPKRLREKTRCEQTVYARVKEEARGSGKSSTMNPDAEEFIPADDGQDNAATATPLESPPVEQPAEQPVDLLQLHQQRHAKRRTMNAGQARQKQKALTRRQRRNDARGYVPPPGAKPLTVEKAAQPVPEKQLIRLESINVTCLDHNKKCHRKRCSHHRSTRAQDARGRREEDAKVLQR